MKHLGFENSRWWGMIKAWAREQARMALDHPEVSTKLVILDIVPDLSSYQKITQEFATSFLPLVSAGAAASFPETMVANSAEYFEVHAAVVGRKQDHGPDARMDQQRSVSGIFPDVFWSRRQFMRFARINAAWLPSIWYMIWTLDKKIQCPLLARWSEK